MKKLTIAISLILIGILAGSFAAPVSSDLPVFGAIKAYAKLEPSGTLVKEDKIQLRFDLFLDFDAPGHDIHYVNVPVIPPEGYTGVKDTHGAPVSQADYDIWVDGLPRIWKNNPFLGVLVYVDYDVTDEEIKRLEQDILREAYGVWSKQTSNQDVIKVLQPILGEPVFRKPSSEESMELSARLFEIKSKTADFEYYSGLVFSMPFSPSRLFANPGAIDIGAVAEDRDFGWASTYTTLNLTNPANDTGEITSVEVWADVALTGFIAGTFYHVSGDDYKCRDSEAIGNVVSGSKQTFAGLTINVTTGDFIGEFCDAGSIENDHTGAGTPYVSGEYIDPNDQATYTDYTATMSLFGIGSTPAVAPTVTTQAADDLEDTTATLNGTVTDDGDATIDYYGFVWDTGADQGDPGDVDPSGPAGAWDYGWKSGEGDYGENPFDHAITGLPEGTTIHFRAAAHNSVGWEYGAADTFLTKPAAPTNVAATDGTHSDKVVVTWTKSTGATGYKVYEGVNLLDTLGDVATYDDDAAPSGTVSSAGTEDATDGDFAAHVVLSIAGESVANGASRTYKVKALNGTGDSDDSGTNAGYTTPGVFSYQWWRSAADADAGYGELLGATTDPYNDTTAPAGGDGRYYYCKVSAVDASNNPQDTGADRGFRQVAPEVDTNACDDIEDTTATGNGEIIVIGGENADIRGFVWSLDTHGDPGNVSPAVSDYENDANQNGSFGLGVYDGELTGLDTGDQIYVRAYVHTPSGGYDYGYETDFLTKPAAPTNVAATSNQEDEVTITWTKSTGATDYHVFRGAVDLGPSGDVATEDDPGATAGTITNAGTVTATDGTETAHVELSLAGEATGITEHSYTVVASNATGDSDASGADNGNRSVGAITYQWQVDEGGGYGNIVGGTTDPYNETGAPAGTISNAGTVTATSGVHTDKVVLSLAGEATTNGTTYDYQCIVSATGASNTPQTSDNNDGYRGVGAITFQWQVDDGGGYDNIVGGTTDSYDYTGAPAGVVTPGAGDASDGTSPVHVVLSLAGESVADGATYDYQCIVSSVDASNSPQTSDNDDGYRTTGVVTYAWQRSAGDSDDTFGAIGGGTTDPYNDIGAPANGDGRWYYCEVAATGAATQDSTHDRGYRLAGPTVTTQAATNIEDTTATGNGNITDTGGENCDIRGIVWDLGTHGDPGNVSPAVSDYANDVAETPGPFGTGAFTRSLTGLPTGDTIYVRAYAHNSEGYAYGAEVNFLTKPAAPTNVAATDGAHNDKVTITWTKSTGATDYHVWRDAVDLGASGDVATEDDAGATAGIITPGTATASDGMVAAHVVLSLAGESTADGTPHTYKVVASNATGDSDDSTTDTGYRGVGAITYQWQRSAADSDAAYGNIGGGTTDPYNDVGAPADAARWFLCLVDADGAVQAESTHDRGWRGQKYLVIYIDNVEEDAVLLGEATVPGNNNDWIINQNDVMPYMDYYKHTVGGDLIAWYQPVSMIVGTNLDDREGTDIGETGAAEEDATITWGTNPAGISVSLGSLISSDQPTLSPASEEATPDIVPEGSIPVAGTVNTSKLQDNPVYPVVKVINEYTDYTEEQIWFIGATLILLIAMGIAVVKVPNHLLLAGTIGMVVGGFFTAMEIYQFVMSILMERKPVL